MLRKTGFRGEAETHMRSKKSLSPLPYTINHGPSNSAGERRP